MTVPTITDDLVAELEMLAGKATPGPWHVDSHGMTMMGMETLEVVFMHPQQGKAVRHEETGNLSHWRNDWDASFIATANPATIRALLTERAELKLDAERLAAVIKDVHWRVDDTTEQLQATGHDGDRRYGLDEWSGPIKNLKMAIEILAKAMQEQPS